MYQTAYRLAYNKVRTMLSPLLQAHVWDRLPHTAREKAWDRLPRRLQKILWHDLAAARRQELLWPNGPPRQAWHSFDRRPWQHPWLTPDNIRAFRAFSDEWLSRLEKRVERTLDRPGRTYAFAGNIANNLYSRAKAMGTRPVAIAIHPHPHDRFLMSHPSWEEFDGELLAPEIDSVEKALAAGMPLPRVPCVVEQHSEPQPPAEDDLPAGMRLLDLKRYRAWLTYLPTIQALRDYDAILAVQAPYLAYLSGKPYVATQMGGDIWYEASRDDEYGRLQRESFSRAGAFMVSNPWSLSFARRYGMSNMVYLPYLIDENRYSPGEPECREEWRAATGGEFFVLMTSRVDYLFKGSDIAIRGFARFAAKVPQARLVITGWGSDQGRAAELFKELGIADKVHVVPIVGKKRLVRYLRSADCVLDQLSIGYYGAAALEAMACGRPVIMNLNQAQYDALLPEGCAPVCNASTEAEVTQYLRRLFEEPEWRAQSGERLRHWFLRTHDNRKWSRLYDAVLLGSALGRLPSFRGSPLHAGWDNAEAAYQAAELAAAPQFPNYF